MVRKLPEFSRLSLIFSQKVPFSRFFRFSLSCTNPACCCNNFRIGAKTYQIGDVIGADPFDLNAPTIGIYRSMADKPERSSLPSLIFLVFQESVKLGILGVSRAEMVRNVFTLNIDSVTYGSAKIKGKATNYSPF